MISSVRAQTQTAIDYPRRMAAPVFVLGGSQTDFSRHYAREKRTLIDAIGDALAGALADTKLEAEAIQSAHVGNFCGELFTGQGQLGGALSIVEPRLYGVPAMRHEAACASGGVSVLAAMAEIEAGRYDCVLVVGAEMERNVSGTECARHHDCFSMSEYMAIDHFGITPPGESYRAIESGELARTGKMPMNPSGGLIGGGHPVGATGVRMVFDAAKQVAGRAGDMQVEGATRVGTLNIGGSTTTTVAMVIGV